MFSKRPQPKWLFPAKALSEPFSQQMPQPRAPFADKFQQNTTSTHEQRLPLERYRWQIKALNSHL